MDYIDNVTLHSQMYTGVTNDLNTNNARTTKFMSSNFTTQLASIHLGDLSNGKIVRVIGSGAVQDINDVANNTAYGIDVILYVDPTGVIHENRPLVSQSVTANGGTIIPLNVTWAVIDGNLVISNSLEGLWSILVDIV